MPYRPGAGRKKIVINLEILRALCEVQCTLDEIAAGLKINIDTLRARMADTPEVRDIIEAGASKGRASLRRLMWRTANHQVQVEMKAWDEQKQKFIGKPVRMIPQSAATMQIHLSKHWLGMTEKSLLQVEGNVNFTQEPPRPAAILLGTDGRFDPEKLEPAEVDELLGLCDLFDRVGYNGITSTQHNRLRELLRKGDASGMKPIKLLPPKQDNKEDDREPGA